MEEPSMIEYMVLALIFSLLFIGSMTLGIFIGYKLYKSAQNPKWFRPPSATERSQAIREQASEDKSLKGFMDAYSKGLYMTQEDFKKGAKEKSNV